jgi:DNA-binding protein HU-beta
VAEGVKESKSLTWKLLDTFLVSIEEALVRGEDVTLAGFGKFSISKRAARTGRNPRDGSPVNIPAKKAVKFQAQRALKEAVQ